MRLFLYTDISRHYYIHNRALLHGHFLALFHSLLSFCPHAFEKFYIHCVLLYAITLEQCYMLYAYTFVHCYLLHLNLSIVTSYVGFWTAYMQHKFLNIVTYTADRCNIDIWSLLHFIGFLVRRHLTNVYIYIWALLYTQFEHFYEKFSPFDS